MFLYEVQASSSFLFLLKVRPHLYQVPPAEHSEPRLAQGRLGLVEPDRKDRTAPPRIPRRLFPSPQGCHPIRNPRSAQSPRREPIPCWSHLSPEQYRRRVLSLVEQIEEETALRRSRTGARPLGREAVLAQDPHHRPAKIKKSPAPFVHAISKAVRRELWEAYALIVAAYRTAADRPRAGDRQAVFPLGCFPSALPFVGG